MVDLRFKVRHVRQAVGLVWRAAPGWTLLQAGVVLLQGVLPVAMLLLVRRGVDAAGVYLAQPPGLRDPGPLLLLLPWAALVTAAGWLARAGSSLAAETQAEAVADFVQDRLQAKAMEVDLECYETPEYHDLMRLAQSDAMSRPVSLVRNGVQLAAGIVVLIAIGGVLWATQGFLLAVLVLAAVPGMAARVVNARRRNEWRVRQGPADRKAGYLHVLLTSLPFAKEIRTALNGQELRRRYRELRTRRRASRVALIRRRAAAELLAEAAAAGIVLAGAGLLLLRLQNRAATLGDLALLAGGFQKGRAAVRMLLISLAALYEDGVFLSHFHAFMGLPRRIRAPGRPRPVPDSVRRGIRFEQVTFRYPGTEADVLRDLDLELAAGEHVALVGENGSGKTTLVKLLCRLYDPTRGRILLDGVDIREFDPDAYRRRISVLFQDFIRYQMSAGDNIRMGDISVPAGDPRIAQAAQRAGADGILAHLPAGQDTLLGRMFAGGADLSEGQWQRLALARAMLRPAPLVFFDEPTSALDARAERELLQSAMGLLAGRTALVVSHRCATVRAADRILMLADGQLVESGTHEALVEASGAYAGLFALHRPD